MSSAGAPIPDFQLPYTTTTPGGQNGRVNLTPQSAAGGSTVPDTAGFSYPTKTEKVFSGDMLRGNWEHTALSEAFFTQTNTEIIQRKIKEEVYRRSGPKKYVIDDQDVDEIKMIMRAMYLQYAKNNPTNIQGQINELNNIIIEWSAPRILSEVDHYLHYLNDISHMPVPLAQPMNMSSAGTRSLPLQPYM